MDYKLGPDLWTEMVNAHILLNVLSLVKFDWRVINAKKQQQGDSLIRIQVL